MQIANFAVGGGRSDQTIRQLSSEKSSLLYVFTYERTKGFYIETELSVVNPVMPRKGKSQLFGVFDEQATSVLVSLSPKKEANFGELLKETRLSKASLSRALKRLCQAAIVRKTGQGYAETKRSREIVDLTLRIAERQTKNAIRKVERRLSDMARDYRVERRIYHNDPMWERTADKALVEVMSMRGMTPLESLLFHQRFQEETGREEQKLWRSSATP